LDVDNPERQLAAMTTSELRATGSFNITQEFHLTNVANEPVTTTLLGVNCTCVDVLDRDHELKLNDQVTIGTSETRSLIVRRPFQPDGGLTQSRVLLSVQSKNNSRASQLILGVEKYVIPDVQIMPLVIREAITTAQASDFTKSVVVTAAARDGAWLDKATIVPDSLPAGIKLKEVTTLSESRKTWDDVYSKRWQVAIQIDSALFNPAHKPSVTADLRLQVKDGTRPDVVLSRDIPVALSYAYGVSAPQVVNVGATSLDKPAKCRFQLSANDAKPFSLTHIEVSQEPFLAKAALGENRTSHWVDVEFQPAAEGKSEAELKIGTSLTAYSELKVKLIAVALSPAK
jgi:hypothetical protein